MVMIRVTTNVYLFSGQKSKLIYAMDVEAFNMV